MSSDVTLRIAYFSLNLVGGFAMTIMILTLCLEVRRLRQGTFLATLALCSSRIISTVVSSLLLFSGSMTGKRPPETLCIVQSSLHNAQTPFISYVALSYTGTILLLMSHSLPSWTRVTQILNLTLLAIPFIILITLSIISIAARTQQLNAPVSPLFYCILDHKILCRVAAIMSAVALFATIVVIIWIFYKSNPRDSQSGDIETAWIEGLSISLLLLGLYTTVRLGFWIANYVKETVASDMLDAVDGIVLFFIIATQGWLRSSWNRWVQHLSRPTSEQNQTTSQPTSQVYGHSMRQVVSVPSVIDIRTMHPIEEEKEEAEEVRSPKLLALTNALGLDSVEPPIMRAINPSPKLQSPERNLSSVEPEYGSFTSLKSMQYGVALGHPSRDVSRDPTPANFEGHLEDARESSLITLPITSDKWSEHNLDEPVHDVTETNIGSSQMSHPQAIYLTPLFRHPRTPLHMPITLASWGADRLSLDEVGGLATHASFIPVSVDSQSRSTTPRSQGEPRPSFEHPLHPHDGSAQTVEILTEEGAIWSTSSESGPPILMDASASSLSWPNISSSSPDLRHHGATGSNTGRIGVSSPTNSINRGHRATPSTTSSRYLGPSRWSPSPLSLDENGDPTIVPFRPTRPSPEPHPFTRGVSPFRPPGLHFRSNSDRM